VTAAENQSGRRPIPLAHGYATTPPYLRRGHDGPVLGLGHVEAVAPRLHPDRVYDVAPPGAVRQARDPLEPISVLLAEVPGRSDRAPPRPPGDASRSLAELGGERHRLAEHLRAAVPPDVRPELRRVGEERDWLLSVPDRLGRPEGRQALATLDARLADLTAQTQRRAGWIQDNRGLLERWAELGQAIDWREAALGRGAEVRPTVAVTAALGPAPVDARQRAAWCRAAEAVEAHRERWALPDRPLELTAGNSPPEPSRRISELRVLAASRDLQHSRARDDDRSLAPSGW
jgi:hypothetical protein